MASPPKVLKAARVKGHRFSTPSMTRHYQAAVPRVKGKVLN